MIHVFSAREDLEYHSNPEKYEGFRIVGFQASASMA